MESCVSVPGEPCLAAPHQVLTMFHLMSSLSSVCATSAVTFPQWSWSPSARYHGICNACPVYTSKKVERQSASCRFSTPHS